MHGLLVASAMPLLSKPTSVTDVTSPAPEALFEVRLLSGKEEANPALEGAGHG